MARVGETLELQITGMSSSMAGVGRTREGMAVFVPGALPGETVRCQVVKADKRFLSARLDKVLSFAPERREPQCALYGQCGGCSAQHMDYAATLLYKRQRVEDAFARIARMEHVEVLPVMGMDMPWRYRNKAEYAVAAGDAGGFGAGASAPGVAIGGFAPGSHRVVDFEDCLLQHPGSVALMRALKSLLRSDAALRKGLCYVVTRVNDEGEMGLTLSYARGARGLEEKDVGGLARGLQSGLEGEWAGVSRLISLAVCRLRERPAHALDGECRVVWGAGTITDHALGHAFELAPQSFFQVNRAQADVLYRGAVDMAALEMSDTVIDLYCGVGPMTLLLARRAREAVGIEIFEGAVSAAQGNARRAGIDNARFITGDAALELPRLLESGIAPDVIVMDPPRAGVDPRVIEAIRGVAPRRVVYVSCDPGTLARDVALFCAGGEYRVSRVQPVDMFPWTAHVETVVLMSRVEG